METADIYSSGESGEIAGKAPEAVAELKKLAADAGLPLTHLALAFVRTHPADAVLDDAILDRIDEIVPPGRT